MRISVVQMNSGADVAANLEQLKRLLQDAASEGANLAVLPENFALMSENRAQRLAIAEDDTDGPIQAALSQMAADLGLWLVAGTLPLKSADPERPLAASCVFNAAGERVARYDKVHLFDVHVPDGSEAYAESSYTLQGNSPLTLSTPWGRLGVAVCYDLRFPEQFRQMAAEGLDLIALPAAFTVPTGQAHWEILLRARAVENLCYVAAAAQVGSHPGGRSTWGHSMIVEPWGRVLADAEESVSAITVSMDRAELDRIRTKFPVLEHRRL